MKYLMRLYGDGGDGSADDEQEQELSINEDEARALQEVKTVLDSRERHRPPASTIDVITAAAALAVRPAARRQDRMPARHSRRVALPIGLGTIAVLAVGILLILTNPTSPSPRDDLARTPLVERTAPTESLLHSHENLQGQMDVASRMDGVDEIRREPAIPPQTAETPRVSGYGEPITNDQRRRPAVASALQPASTSTLTRSAATTKPVASDLAWDDSEEVREVYRELMQLELMSPAGGQWRPVVADPLATPIGVSPSYRLTRLE